MAYWVYEDKPTNHATVHEGACGYCNEGAGVRKAKKSTALCQWHGPFDEEHEAWTFGQGLGRPLTVHGCCAHPYGKVSVGGYKKFQLDEIDESTLSALDLFHRRMLQIYVSLRDETGYKAIRFLGAVRRHGGVAYAKSALSRYVGSQSGLVVLREMERLDQTMEWHVTQPEFAELFTPAERAEARRRLGT